MDGTDLASHDAVYGGRGADATSIAKGTPADIHRLASGGYAQRSVGGTHNSATHKKPSAPRTKTFASKRHFSVLVQGLSPIRAEMKPVC